MNSSAQITAYLLVVVLVANWPFMSQRVLLLGPRRPAKTLAWRLAELVVLYFLVGLSGLLLENHAGQNAPQGWEFYAITATMYLTLAFPGFVYRYLMQRPAR